MECPHCKQELKLAPRVLWNVDQYQNFALAATECCGNGVDVQPIRSYRVTRYAGAATEDDWGVEFTKIPCGELDLGAPNHYNPDQRGFQPK